MYLTIWWLLYTLIICNIILSRRGIIELLHTRCKIYLPKVGLFMATMRLKSQRDKHVSMREMEPMPWQQFVQRKRCNVFTQTPLPLLQRKKIKHRPRLDWKTKK